MDEFHALRLLNILTFSAIVFCVGLILLRVLYELGVL